MKWLEAVIAGIVVGLILPTCWAWLLLRITPPQPSANLVLRAEAYEDEAKRLQELAGVLRRLADGDDPDDIEADLSDRLKSELDDWKDGFR